jgi:hypothetical protein
MLLSVKKLFPYFENVLGESLPFSVSSLNKDRADGRLGIPYRRLGGAILYSPVEVQQFLQGLPALQPKSEAPPPKKRGKPTKRRARGEAE